MESKEISDRITVPPPERLTGQWIGDQARNRAIKDILDLHRGEYELLYSMWLTELKKHYGYVDLRPAANRRHKRRIGGIGG